MSKRGCAAVVALVVAAACSSGDDDESERRTGGHELTESVVGPGGLLSALDDERNASMLSVMGLGGGTEDAGLADARRATEEAVDAVARQDDGEAYPSSEASVRTLKSLRANVDAAAASGASTAQFDLGMEIFDGYSAIVDEYVAAGRDSVVEITDDPGLREGMVLLFDVREAVEADSEIVLRIFGTQLDPAPDSSDRIAELSRAATEQQEVIDHLKGTEREPYRSIVESSFPEDQHQKMAGFVEDAVNGRTVSVLRVLETAGGESPEAAPYLDLLLELWAAVDAEAG